MTDTGPVDDQGTQANSDPQSPKNNPTGSDDDTPMTRGEFTKFMQEFTRGTGQTPTQSRTVPPNGMVSGRGSGLSRDELNSILDERESRKSSQDEITSLKAEVSELRDTLKKQRRKVFSPWGF